MPWWAYLLAGTPLAAVLAYGQWLGVHVLTHDRAIKMMEAHCTSQMAIRAEERQALVKMVEKLDNLSAGMAGLSAKMDMLINGRA